MLDISMGLMLIIGGIIMLSCGVHCKELKHRKSFIRAGVGIIVVGVLFLIF